MTDEKRRRAMRVPGEITTDAPTLAEPGITTVKGLLALAAVGEAAMGVGLLIVPALVGKLLLGVELTGDAAVVARVAGIALIGLAVACWPGTPLLGMLAYSAALPPIWATSACRAGRAGCCCGRPSGAPDPDGTADEANISTEGKTMRMHRIAASTAGDTHSERGAGRHGSQAEGVEVAADTGPDHRGGLSGGMAEAAQPTRAVAHERTRTNPWRRCIP